jgi:hypothetical protein
MAGSRTKRKYPNKNKAVIKSQLETAADLVSGYIKHWTRQEADRLLKTENTPLIVPTKTGWKVGRYEIITQSQGYWTVVDSNKENPLDFAEKRSAILYCISHQTRRYSLAHDVLLKDQQYAKLYTDHIYYEHCIRRALKRNDMFTVDALRARSDDTKHKLELAKNDLQKTLNQAKYIKIWDNLL